MKMKMKMGKKTRMEVVIMETTRRKHKMVYLGLVLFLAWLSIGALRLFWRSFPF